MTSRQAQDDVANAKSRRRSGRLSRTAENGELGVVTEPPLHEDDPTHGGGRSEGDKGGGTGAPEGEDLGTSHLVKVAVLGAPGVGKTALIKVTNKTQKKMKNKLFAVSDICTIANLTFNK